MLFSPGGANSTPPNPLNGVEGPLRGMEMRQEEGRGIERGEKDRMKGRKNPKQISGYGLDQHNVNL